jgi:lipopolysaccharide export system permease protein
MIEARTKLFSWHLIKYLAVEVFFSFIIGTGIFLLILLLFQFIRLSDFVVVHQVGLKDVGKLSVYMILSFFPIAIPIAFLFAVLMGISRSNSDGEIIAMQANGISIHQIFAPLAAFSVLVSLVSLYTGLFTVPRANRAFELLITRLENERVMAGMKPGVFQEGFLGLVLFAEHIVPVKNEMKRVFIYDERDEGHPLAITAQAGVLRSVPETGIVTLRLSNGSIYVDKRKAEGVQQKIDFEVYDINLDMGVHGGSWREPSPPSHTLYDLQRRLKETEKDIPENRKLKVEFHRRFSMAFSCLVFAGLGFFIGIRSQKGIRSTAIILCILVGLVYWLAIVGSNAMALTGWVAPWLGVWAPNFFFTGVAYWLFRRSITLR